jgi:DNA mismatch endonuclease (patch repair protein)
VAATARGLMVISDELRRRMMQANKSKNTSPEIRLRRALHKLGLRYRLHVKSLPGKPDIVFPSLKLAIQVQGCFWHQHNCRDGRVPRSNSEYWAPKLFANVERDARNAKALHKLGWQLITIWACNLTSIGAIEKVANEIKETVDGHSRLRDLSPIYEDS